MAKTPSQPASASVRAGTGAGSSSLPRGTSQTPAQATPPAQGPTQQPAQSAPQGGAQGSASRGTASQATPPEPPPSYAAATAPNPQSVQPATTSSQAPSNPASSPQQPASAAQNPTAQERRPSRVNRLSNRVNQAASNAKARLSNTWRRLSGNRGTGSSAPAGAAPASTSANQPTTSAQPPPQGNTNTNTAPRPAAGQPGSSDNASQPAPPAYADTSTIGPRDFGDQFLDSGTRVTTHADRTVREVPNGTTETLYRGGGRVQQSGSSTEATNPQGEYRVYDNGRLISGGDANEGMIEYESDSSGAPPHDPHAYANPNPGGGVSREQIDPTVEDGQCENEDNHENDSALDIDNSHGDGDDEHQQYIDEEYGNYVRRFLADVYSSQGYNEHAIEDDEDDGSSEMTCRRCDFDEEHPFELNHDDEKEQSEWYDDNEDNEGYHEDHNSTSYDEADQSEEYDEACHEEDAMSTGDLEETYDYDEHHSGGDHWRYEKHHFDEADYHQNAYEIHA